MKFTGDGINKAVKIIIGILMLALGILFLAMPVLTAAVAVFIAGILLVIAGAVEFITCLAKKCRDSKRPSSIVTGIFKLFLGILLLVADRGIVLLLPVIVTIWLAVFGVYRIVLGVRRKRNNVENWTTSVAIGIIAIGGAVAIAVVRWVAAMDMIGVLIAVLAMLYGFVVLMDAFGKKSQESVEERLAEGKIIADDENAEFRRYQEKLHKK